MVSSGRSGGSSRSTSAPSAPRYLVATGPAMTRVRSSTLMPAAGSGPAGRQRGGAPPTDVASTSGVAATARPGGSARQLASSRTAAAIPPTPVTRSSASQAPSSAIAAATGSGSPSASVAQP